MKSHVRVAIIGGGIFGVSLLYHLTKEGWGDVVLVEKGELTSGSTWHAAGQVPNFIGSLAMAHVHFCGTELYPRLEEETGQSAGWHGCGGIRLATTPEEVDWFHHVEGIGRQIGFEMHVIGPNEIKNIHPYLETFGVLAGAYTTQDGHVDPSSATQAMAIGARAGGAEIYRHNRVTDVNLLASGEWELITENGTITAEHVVNAAGSYANDVSAMVGLRVPVVNMVHQYFVTEPLDEIKALDKELPVVRDPYSSSYLRQEQNALLIGPYETEGARACFVDGMDWSFDMELLEPELDRVAPWLEKAAERLPLFGEAGIRRIVSGPITHTPDGNFLLGPAPGPRNYWMACGASVGICQGAGAGKYLAQQMVHGQAEINMASFDPRRYGDWSLGDYAMETSIEEYEHMYQALLPGEYRPGGRPNRVSALYEILSAKGARWAFGFGWERPQWFSSDGAEETYGYRRSNAFQAVAAECQAVRERVGVLDLSSFAKFEVTGSDAETLIDRLGANRAPRKDGGIALTHFLTEDGMIEGEATVTRLSENRFYVLSGTSAEVKDLDILCKGRRAGEDVQITNVTDDFGVLVVSGPQSREVLAGLTEADLTNAGFRWLSAREIEVAGVACRALRVSYVGELGWELHCSMADLVRLYEVIMQAGAGVGIADFGLYAMNSLRLEKGYKGMGTELTNEITMIEADMERFVHFDNETFVGRDSLLRRNRDGIATKLVQLEIDATDADAMGNEPVISDGRVVGVVTSGGYGHWVGKSLAFAYVEPSLVAPGTKLVVSILGADRPARVLAEPPHDPENVRMRG